MMTLMHPVVEVRVSLLLKRTTQSIFCRAEAYLMRPTTITEPIHLVVGVNGLDCVGGVAATPGVPGCGDD